MVTEEFHPLAECPEAHPCTCGGRASKIISLGHGGIWRVEPTWINDDLRGSLQDTDAIAAKRVRPIEDRNDYSRFLRENPNIRPKE
jgi:hypothetical protein